MDATRYGLSGENKEMDEMFGNDWKLELREALGMSRYQLMKEAREAALRLAGINGFSVLLDDQQINYDKRNLL